MTVSDKRLKKVISNIETPLDKVEHLNGVRYSWTDEAITSSFTNDIDQVQIGIVADEVNDILPEIIQEVNGYKQVEYEKLVPLLVEAIKELNAKIKQLQPPV